MNNHEPLIKSLLFSTISLATALMENLAEWNTILANVGGILGFVTAVFGLFYLVQGIRIRNRELNKKDN